MKKIIFLILIIASQAFAQNTYYVSSSGGSDSNNGLTEATAWATLNKVNSTFNVGANYTPGDSILLKRGDKWNPSSMGGYQGVLDLPAGVAGTRDNPIVFADYGDSADPDPIISAENLGGVAGTRVFYSDYISWVEFRNIHFDRTGAQNALRVQASTTNPANGIDHVTWYNCTFNQTGIDFNNAFSGGSPYSTVHSRVPNDINITDFAKYTSIRIDHCTFINGLGSGGTINFGPYDSLYVGYSTFYCEIGSYIEEALDVSGGYDHIIEYNKFYGSSANMIKLHSQYTHLERAIVRGNLVVFADWGYTGGYGLALENVKDCQVYNNTIYSPQVALWIGNLDRYPYESYYGNFEGNLIANNIFHGFVYVAGTWGTGTILTNEWGYSATMPYVNQVSYNDGRFADGMFDQNTFSNNTYYRDYDIRLRMSESPTGLIVDARTEAEFIAAWDMITNGTDDWRDVYGSFTSPFTRTVTQRGTWDPYNPGDYTLIDTSPEINDGIYITGYTQDIDGNPIVGLPDRGCYENQSASGTVSPYLSFSTDVGTFTAPKLDMGSIQPSTTKLVNLSILNESPDSVIIITSITEADDSSKFAEVYTVSGSPITFPYELQESTTINCAITFSGSAYTGKKYVNLSIVHGSYVQTSPYVVSGEINVTTSTVTYAITGDTTKVFTTTLGSELVTNYGFTNWTNDVPDNWTQSITSESPTNYIEESPTGSLHLVSDGNWNEVRQNNILTIDVPHVYEVQIDSLTGGVKWEISPTITWTTTGLKKAWFEPGYDDVKIARNTGGCNAYINSFSVKAVTSDYDGLATISHSGTGGTLSCDSIKFLDGTNFTLTSATTFSLSVDDEYSLTYEFAPSDTGYFQDTIIVYGITADNRTNDTLEISGYFDSDLQTSIANIGFIIGDLFVADTDTASTSDTTFQAVYNNGDATLTIDSITVPSHYTLLFPTSPGDTTLSAGDTLTVTLRFAPTTVGTKSGYMNFYSDADNHSGAYGLPVSGLATAVSTPPYMAFINPTNDTLDFGTVQIGGSVNKSVIWRNDGTEMLTYTADQTLNDGTQGFVYVSGAYNDSTATTTRDTLVFSFTPSSAGSFSDGLPITNNSDNLSSPHTIYFTGVGVNTIQNYAIDKDGYVFATAIDKGDTSSITFTISNSGDSSLVGVISKIGTNPGCTLVNGGSYSTTTTKTFTIQAHPLDEMSYYCDFEITHNATNATSPDTVRVWFTGNLPAEIKLFPPQYQFAETAIGVSRVYDRIYAYNMGKDTLTVDSVYLNTNTVFTLPDTSGATLNPNLVGNGRFDRSDTIWVSNAASPIVDGKSNFTEGYPIYQSLTGLAVGGKYALVMDVSGHNESGDHLYAYVGETSVLTTNGIHLTPSEYSDGKLLIEITAGTTSTNLWLFVDGGTKATRLDNIVLSSYIRSSVTYTPVEGDDYNTDILYYEHDGTQTNPYPMPIEAYKKTGNIIIPGNIRR